MIPATLNSVRWDEVNQIKYRFQAMQFSSDGRFYKNSCCDVIYGSSNINFTRWQPLRNITCSKSTIETLGTLASF